MKAITIVALAAAGGVSAWAPPVAPLRRNTAPVMPPAHNPGGTVVLSSHLDQLSAMSAGGEEV